MNTNEKIQFAMVIVACFSIIVPVFGKLIKWIIYKPKLAIKLDNNSDELFTDCQLQSSSAKRDTKSLKLRIHNYGCTSAENVQITLLNLSFENPQGKKTMKISPLKLYWSYQDDRRSYKLLPLTMKKIQPKSFEDCDFIFFDKQIKYGFFAGINSQVIIKESGKYEIKLMISGDNFNSFMKTITFSFAQNDEFIHDLHY